MKIKVKKTFLYNADEQATILWALDMVDANLFEDPKDPKDGTPMRVKARELAAAIRKNSP